MKTKICWLLLSLACPLAYAAHQDEIPMPVSTDVNVTATLVFIFQSIPIHL